MRPSFLQLAFCFLVSTQAFASKVVWFNGTFEEAKSEATAKNKSLFVVIHAEWCGPCQYFLHNTLEDERLSAYVNDNTIPYLVDGYLHPEFSEIYLFKYFPTIILARPNSEEIARVGNDDVEETYKNMKNVIENGKTVNELLAQIADSPEIPALKMELLEKYCERMAPDQGEAVAGEIRQSHPEFFEEQKSKIFLALGRAFFFIESLEKAKTYFQTIVDLKLADIEMAYYFLGHCLLREQNLEAFFAVVAKGISEVPQTLILRYQFLWTANMNFINVEQGIGYGLELIELEPANMGKGYANYSVAFGFYKLKNKESALKHINEAIRLDPTQNEYVEFRKAIEEDQPVARPDLTKVKYLQPVMADFAASVYQ